MRTNSRASGASQHSLAGRGSPRFVLSSSDSHSVFLGMPRFVPICSDSSDLFPIKSEQIGRKKTLPPFASPQSFCHAHAMAAVHIGHSIRGTNCQLWAPCLWSKPLQRLQHLPQSMAVLATQQQENSSSPTTTVPIPKSSRLIDHPAKSCGAATKEIQNILTIFFVSETKCANINGASAGFARHSPDRDQMISLCKSGSWRWVRNRDKLHRSSSLLMLKDLGSGCCHDIGLSLFVPSCQLHHASPRG